MAGRIKTSFFRGVSAVADIYTSQFNKLIDARNKRRSKKGKALLTPIEKRRPSDFKSLMDIGIAYNPNKDGRCSAYATRTALKQFGKKFVKVAAWELPNANRVVYHKPSGISHGEMQELIRRETINPGTIVGVFYKNSENNLPGREFTHVMVYMGNNTFWHNWEGPRKITVDKLYSATTKKGDRIFVPIVVIEPKE